MNETSTLVHPASGSNTLADKVRKALSEAAAPLTFTDVKKALKAAGVPLTGKAKVSDTEIQQELEKPGVHIHPAPTARGKPKYWHRPPQTVAERIAETVRARVAALGDEPVKPNKANFGKPAASDGSEAQAAFDAVVKQLLAEGKLFEHPGGKYGRKPPPKKEWYETPPHKAEFTKFVTAAKKVLNLGGVSAEELFGALREQLGLGDRVAQPEPKPQQPPTPQVAPTSAASPDLQTKLKEAFDHLCKFPEFRDRLVDLPSLYHETTERVPGLTVEAFRRELWQLSEGHRIELHVLNEVSLAREPHLAIQRNDRLYYFARWK